ncbi:hypothetical protein L596_013269 [Steinernema carpocapsae]|uniref:NOL1/NOP2/Sun domain family member 4 n=1 Tax=Steinernema carpocapsae TaxID=34508 RepID=A0A4U5P0H2_STECR|nr:hypothetical protein L596_013269 [Steinernema carpocapsae]
MLALDHFDFYYGPLFGKRWPSIRLGLVSPNKFIAIANRFSNSFETNQQILADIGSEDLIAKLTSGKKASERIAEKKKRTEEKPLEADEYVEHGVEAPKQMDEELLDDRSDASLGEFTQPTQSVTSGELQMGMKDAESRLDRLDIKVTGLEGQFANLPSKEDFIYYPRELKAFTFPRGSMADFPFPNKDADGVPGWWLLDGGSLVPVLALNLQHGDTVLDMCAAPGGKSLLVLQTGLAKKLVCNDFKLARLGQLQKALSMYVPETCAAADRVILKRRDATNLEAWDEECQYDKVLVDVPCTTDRLAAQQDEGNLYSATMSNERLNLPQIQTKILLNALRSVKVGGYVIYSTCALSPVQNESVIENAVAIASEKMGMEVIEKKLVQLERHLSSTGFYKFSEQCRRGSLVIPFLPSNFGPMYVCKLQRTK